MKLIVRFGHVDKRDALSAVVAAAVVVASPPLWIPRTPGVQSKNTARRSRWIIVLLHPLPSSCPYVRKWRFKDSFPEPRL